NQHKNSHQYRAYFYQHLLLNEPVRYEFSFFVLRLQSQSNHHDQLVDQIEKFGKLWDCLDKNSFYDQNGYLLKWNNSKLTQLSFQIRGPFDSSPVTHPDNPNQSRWYCY